MRIDDAVNIEDFRQAAKHFLPRIVFDYIEGGADDELGLRHNRERFESIRLLPRFLVDVSKIDTSATLFGQRYRSGIGIAPTGLAGFARPGADLMLARAAVEADIPFILSGAGTASIEQVAKVAPGHSWFQLYVAKDWPVTLDILSRALQAGIKTLVLTVDVPVHGHRERDIRNGFVPPLRPQFSTLWDILMHPSWLYALLRGGLPRFENWAPYVNNGTASAAQIAQYFTSQIPFTQTWHDLEKIRRHWPGTLILKGILHPEDAVQAQQSGVDGLIVSNHGGRQLDFAPSPIECLPHFRKRLGESFPLMLDSGIRRGSDIVKAWALGADFVFVGRAPLYGVAAAGEAGARRCLEMLQEEMIKVLAQVGISSLSALTPKVIADYSVFSEGT